MSVLRAGKARSSPAAAFTLLEVLVAVAVLGTAVVTLLGLHARNIRLSAETRDLTIAGSLAAALAAETRGGPFPEIGTLQGTFTEDDDFRSDLNEQFGGAEAGRFEWHRIVESVGLKNVRQVHIEVGPTGDLRPLASLDFLVRRGGP